MASILVFAKPDNDHPDPTLDALKFKRGMVVDVHDDDDFFWGNDIHGPSPLGWWRIVVLPGVKAADVAALQMGDPSLEPTQPQPHHRRLRTHTVDLDALENAHKTKAGKLKGHASITADHKSFMAGAKQIVPRPRVDTPTIGTDGPFKVIG